MFSSPANAAQWRAVSPVEIIEGAWLRGHSVAEKTVRCQNTQTKNLLNMDDENKAQQVGAILSSESNRTAAAMCTVFAAQVDVCVVVQQPRHHVVVLVIAGARQDTDGSAQSQSQQQQQQHASGSISAVAWHVLCDQMREFCDDAGPMYGCRVLTARGRSLCVLLIDVLSCGLRHLGMIAIERDVGMSGCEWRGRYIPRVGGNAAAQQEQNAVRVV